MFCEFKGVHASSFRIIGFFSSKEYSPLNKSLKIASTSGSLLANKDPDVDAIFRLLFKGEYSFDEKKPIILNEDAWTPLNSQNTVFYKKCFPLLYLPCHVSFRMTDIWRSFFIMAMRKLHPFNIS